MRLLRIRGDCTKSIKRSGMLGLVVDTIEHAIFKGDEVARRMGQVATAGIHQFEQWGIFC
jgi:hypothetical protein